MRFGIILMTSKIVSVQERFDDDDAKEYYASAYNTHSKTTRTTNNSADADGRRDDFYDADASLYVAFFKAVKATDTF